jgi:hypothetical protein
VISLISVRRIKPDCYEEFREAWKPDPWHPKLQRVEVFRCEEDPNQVITVSYIDATADELEAMRDDPAVLESEARRLERIAPFEETVVLSGIYDLVEEVLPPT